jgi:hypothetical protein
MGGLYTEAVTIGRVKASNCRIGPWILFVIKGSNLVLK